MFALAVLLPGPVLAAGFTCATPATPDSRLPAGSDPVLDEVTVTPGGAVRRTRDLNAWLQQLEGQYRYEGYVDVCGEGGDVMRRSVTGQADCVSLNDVFGRQSSISVYCALDVRWPHLQDQDGDRVLEGESHLSPAVVVYGLAPDLPGIQFMQIDNQGKAIHAQGRLVGDTLTARGSCGMAGSCRAITRITATPDGTEVAMTVDVEINSRRTSRQSFLLHRMSNARLTPTPDGARAKIELQSVGER